MPLPGHTAISGKLFRPNLEEYSFELLTETAYDPVVNEGRSRHTVYWNEATRFYNVTEQSSFTGISGPVPVKIRHLDETNATAASEGNPFVALKVVVLAPDEALENAEGWLAGMLTPDPGCENHRAAEVVVAGRPVPMRLRGPRASVQLRQRVRAEVVGAGFWDVTLCGKAEGQRWVAAQVDLSPRIDPRTVDDPSLPRVLVIGDSISMNYHESAKTALRGIANYYRNDGNGGPSDRGVACAELWLGDCTEPGLGWDVIQFNHGLHDLKQTYDEASSTYGEHQVAPEAYQANLEAEIRILKPTGAVLVWCPTTPVPGNSHGTWPNGTFGRCKDEDLVYNRLAMEVMDRHPEIEVNDVNAFIRQSPVFGAWRKQSDVHFWDGALQKEVGQAIARGLERVIQKHGHQ